MKQSLPYMHQPDQAITPPFPLAWAALALLVAQEPQSSARDWLRNQNRFRRLQARSLPEMVEVMFDSTFLYEWRAVAQGSSLPPIVAYLVNRETDSRAHRARHAFAQAMKRCMAQSKVNPQYDVYLVFADKVSQFLGYDDVDRDTRRRLAMLEIEGWVFTHGAQHTASAICDAIVRMEEEHAA